MFYKNNNSFIKKHIHRYGRRKTTMKPQTDKQKMHPKKLLITKSGYDQHTNLN